MNASAVWLREEAVARNRAEAVPLGVGMVAFGGFSVPTVWKAAAG